MDRGMVYLIYHELQIPGRSLCQNEPGYVRYVVGEAEFRRQIASLRKAGVRGISVTQALNPPSAEGPEVVITFDDGSETDLIAAAPLLKEAEFNATFYVVVGYLGRQGHLSHAQIRELAELNFEIGCHSMNHLYLTDQGAKQLYTEIVEAKKRLEQIIGKRVDHFSCPGGRWDRRVAGIAHDAGYRSVATSRIGTNSRTTDRFCMARVGVMRETSLADFVSICQGRALFRRRVKYGVLSLAKTLVGNSMYERMRSAMLGRS